MRSAACLACPRPAAIQTHDVVAALAHWVEDGKAPDQIIATNYRDNDPTEGVVAQRPWCAYPAVARYSGQGDPCRRGELRLHAAGEVRVCSRGR